ncbi:MAG: hypothetical protein GEV13_29395 [Rhodospirillales bacterium]|nr:hypothetical protein [Rhodospirillales bacterium]
MVVAGVGYYIHQNNKDLPSISQAPAPAPPQAAAPANPSASQLANVRSAIADARRMAARGDFYGAADRALDEAERIDAHDPAVVSTRNQLLEAAARPGRRDERN